MKCHEIFQHLSPSLQREIVAGLFEAEKSAYQSAIATLAEQARLRPVFVQRKPRDERHAWLAKALGRKQSEPITASVIQFWLAGPRKDMLAAFLDSLGIEHEAGMVQELPPSPEKEKLAAAIDGLLARFPAEEVSVYLRAFQATDDAGWQPLQELIDSTPALRLPAAAATA